MTTVKIHWKREPALALMHAGRFINAEYAQQVWERLTNGKEGEYVYEGQAGRRNVKGTNRD